MSRRNMMRATRRALHVQHSKRRRVHVRIQGRNAHAMGRADKLVGTAECCNVVAVSMAANHFIVARNPRLDCHND
jgi:hypothetical protein